jgi:hypothetical protein
MRIGQDDRRASTRHTRKLRDRRRKVGQVAEGEGTDDHVEVVVREGQLLEIAHLELSVRHRSLRHRQHLYRRVHTEGLVTLRKVFGVAPCAAGCIESAARGQVADEHLDDRMLNLDQWILCEVVARGRGRIAGARVELLDV